MIKRLLVKILVRFRPILREQLRPVEAVEDLSVTSRHFGGYDRYDLYFCTNSLAIGKVGKRVRRYSP
jgi:hypothetical protein